MIDRRFEQVRIRLASESLVPQPNLPSGIPSLIVEAGSITEVSVELQPLLNQEAQYRVTVLGLPDEWFSVTDVPVSAGDGEHAEAILVLHPPQSDIDSPVGEYPFAVQVADDLGSESSSVQIRLKLLPPGGRTMRSRLVDYLPGVYRDNDPFMGRFLLIFQSIFDPIEHMIDTTDLYFDPDHTPARFLPWLDAWVGVTPDPSLGEIQQREQIRKAAEVSRWKGTRRGLRLALENALDAPALITENFDGMRLGHDAALGLNTALGERQPGTILVTLIREEGADVDMDRVNAVITRMKPAFANHTIRVICDHPDNPIVDDDNS